jgi:hypothetical protein
MLKIIERVTFVTLFLFYILKFYYIKFYIFINIGIKIFIIRDA